MLYCVELTALSSSTVAVPSNTKPLPPVLPTMTPLRLMSLATPNPSETIVPPEHMIASPADSPTTMLLPPIAKNSAVLSTPLQPRVCVSPRAGRNVTTGGLCETSVTFTRPLVMLSRGTGGPGCTKPDADARPETIAVSDGPHQRKVQSGPQLGGVPLTVTRSPAIWPASLIASVVGTNPPALDTTVVRVLPLSVVPSLQAIVPLSLIPTG